MAEAEELFSDPETAESPGDPETASPRPLMGDLEAVEKDDLEAVEKESLYVVYPRRSHTLLSDWCLWGPLILCVALSFSSFQSLSALGYRVLALTVAMLVCRLALLAEPGRITFMIRLFVVIVMFGWSILASSYVVASREPLNHRALAMYPVYLCYFVICWMILSFASE